MPSADSFTEMPLPMFDSVKPAPKPLQVGRLPSYIKDHRKRLHSRFMEGGAEAVPDYEMLEMILFQVIRLGDTKPTARALLDEFGDFARVLSAPPEQLLQIQGVGPSTVTHLKVVEAAAHRFARAKVMQKPVLSGWSALLDYCKTSMSHLPVEQFRVLYLNRKNVLIADDLQGKGTVDHVPVYPREIVKRALEINASALILVHNHPSGDPTPSPQDIEITDKIQTACATLNITVHDHIIVGKSREISFRSEGLL